MSGLSLCCLVAVALIPLAVSVTVPSQYVTKYYYRNVEEYRRVYYRCGSWWRRRRTCSRWQCYIVRRRFSYRGCKDGYRGTACNIPVCNPSCRNRGVCVAIDKCDCPSGNTGATCAAKQCSWARDCYPGICKAAGTLTCDCSSEFEGNNCDIMKEGPTFQKCSARVINQNQAATVNCSFYGDEVKVYTNMVNFTQVEMEWSPTYRKLDDLPPFPAGGFLREFRVGIISVRGEFIVRDTNGLNLKTTPVTCSSNGIWTNPQETIVCKQTLNFNQGVKHKQELEMKMFGTTGGFKDIRNQDTAGTYTKRRMVGKEGSISAHVIFDEVAPIHCTEGYPEYPCDDEYQPIVIDETFTKTALVQIGFGGWNDTDSGLFGYSYGVYEMKANGEGKLQNGSQPILTDAFDLFSDRDQSSFTLPKPGLYAVIAGINDFANNTRYVRCLVLYSGENHTLEEDPSEPLSVSPGAGTTSIDKAYWLSDTTAPVTLKWGKHFRNKFVTQNKFGNEMVPLRGNFLECGNNFSAEGTPNIEGITKFSISVIHKLQDPATRRRRQTTSVAWIPVEPLVDEVQLDDLSGRKSGDGYTVSMKIEDLTGEVMEDYIHIRVDTDPPAITQGDPNFKKNATRPNVDGFFSSVDIAAFDLHGGLHMIDYTVFDIEHPADPRIIANGTQIIPQSTQDHTLCQADNTCWCTREDECYDKPLKFYINNCWFTSHMGVPIKVDLSITNRARLSNSISYDDLGRTTALSGIGEYPPPVGLRLKNAYGYTVTLTWYMPVSCYQIRLMNLELTGASEKSAVLKTTDEEVEITDLVPYAEYTATMTILYHGQIRSEPVTFAFNTGEPPSGQRGGAAGCGTGCIVGIVIGVLILVALVIIIVLVMLRLRKKKTPLPRPMMGVVNRMSRHFGHAGWDPDENPPPYPGSVRSPNKKVDLNDTFGVKNEKQTLNVAYTSGPKLGDFEQDIYTYGELETDAEAKWKHTDDRLTIGRSIHKGRFAEVKQGTLHDHTGTRRVAVKMLLNKSAENVLLMKAKMNFLATAVVKHNNLVNFVGAVTEGPIILLEHCDKSLKDWLQAIEKVTEEVEDDMINFCTDVARGMCHLFENEIKHRRLGARNVLIKHVPEMGRYVGKVTGFGPMKGETGGKDVNSETERIPVKWMAIEQLGLEKGEKRPYNEETDVWSFGVTVWEIFSKGDNPWSKLRSNDVRGVLEKGTRLECPQYASENLYNDIMMSCWYRQPTNRPMFAEIVEKLEGMFHGATDGEMYYADAPLNTQQMYAETRPNV